MATVQLFGHLGGNLNFKERFARNQGNQRRSYNINTMDKSPKCIWGSPAFKDNNNFSLNQRGNNGDKHSVTPTQGSNNNEGTSATRLPWGSPLSPIGTSFGPPISSSSPKSLYYSSDNGKKQMQKGYSGRNYAHDSGGPGGTPHPNSPRYTSPKSPFGGRGRSPFHSSQTHGSPTCKQNQGGSNNNSRSSFNSTPKDSARRFYQDNNTPYCSLNVSLDNFSLYTTFTWFYELIFLSAFVWQYH